MSTDLKQRQFFKISLRTFALVGIDPLAEHTSGIIKHSFLCCGLFVATLVFALAAIDFCIKNIHDINDFTVAVSLLNQLTIALFKIVVFVVKRQRIHKLIKDIWQWNEKADNDEFQIIASKSRKNALLSKCYYVTVLSTGVFGLLLPFIIKLLQLIQGQGGFLQAPHKATYFWSTTNFSGYTAAYIWNIMTIHFLIHASVAIDSLFLWYVNNILIRFQILKKRFENALIETPQNLFRNFIKDAVQLHLHILYLTKELDSIFGEIIFIKSLISCTQICFLAFCLMVKQNTSAVNLLHPLLFLMAVSMQLILYCYNGNLIEEQSLLVSNNAFAAINWSLLPVSDQKMLQMLMVRSQKSSHITGIFFNLNLSLYLWFFKTAASLIAVLKTMEDGS